MKKIFFSLFVLSSMHFYAQEKDKVNFFGGFESNSQWYLNDKGLKNEFGDSASQPDYPLQSNNYLFLNLKYKSWSAGIQGESYQVQDKDFQNFNPEYDKKLGVGTYFLQYKRDKIDLTAGYFYEQFGSGLLFRGWEDRSLGINNALRGGRLIFKPADYLTFKSVYGQQRSGFDVSEGKVFGSDLEIVLSNLMKLKTTELSLGLTYVGRDEAISIEDPNFSRLTNAYAARLNFSQGPFYFSSEYDYKSKDAIVRDRQIKNDFIKPGSALLLNLGYSKKGFGIDGTFRRLENMDFFSERTAKGNKFNDKIVNFIPSLTKQHHYNLANIYTYQAQPNVFLESESLVKAGEIGGQIDVFYNFKKASLFGGKYGTKIALNASNWNALGGTFYISSPQNYETDFLGFGKKYFSDYNLEVTKKLSDKWHTGFTYINQYYSKKLLDNKVGVVKTNILGAEATYKVSASRSIRVEGEHMWADHDRKNWAAGTIEFNANSKFSFYCSDMYNYGNDADFYRNHYFNLGGAFRKNSTRIALNYGRQRGGLVCVGGVCRIVQESSGLSLSLNTTF
jgi:hypothetical protein